MISKVSIVKIISMVLLMVAASHSLAVTVKGNSCEAIQKTINKLPAIGGEVFIPAGKYTCATPIILDRDNLIIRGEGAATLLRVADKANIPVFVMGQTSRVPSVIRRYIQVKNLHIDGNRANQTSECMGGPCSDEFPLRNNGITIRRCEDCVVDNVTVYGAISGGLVTELGCQRLMIRDYTSYDNEYDGFAGYLQARRAVPVNQRVIGGDVQLLHRPAHGQKGGLQNIHLVDLPFAGPADPPSQRL